MARARKKKKDSTMDKLAEKIPQILSGLSVITIRALPLIIIVAAIGAGSMILWTESANDNKFIIEGDTVSLKGSADLCDEAIEEIEKLGRLATGRSALDPKLLTELREAYVNSPWIEEVCSVKRIPPNRVGVEFVIRQPVAQVKPEGTGYYWLIDERGKLLPAPGVTEPRPNLPIIHGSIGKQPIEGQVWNDEGVRDSIGVLMALESSPLSNDLHVKRLRVKRSFLEKLRSKSRPRIEVETHENITIRWGVFNSEKIAGELLTEEKIASLRALAAKNQVTNKVLCYDVRTKNPGCYPLGR